MLSIQLATRALALTLTGVFFLASCSGSSGTAQPATPPATPIPSAVSSSPSASSISDTPQVDSQPPAFLPARLSSGWIFEPSCSDSINGAISPLDEAMPSADLLGGGYGHRNTDYGAMLLTVGEGEVDPATAFYIWEAKGKLERIRLHTLCAKSTSSNASSVFACATETIPSVLAYYVLGTVSKRGLSMAELAEVVASAQAEL